MQLRLLVLVFVNSFLMLSIDGYSQNKSNIRRMGIGAQVFEPTGISLQMFRGYYIDNNSSYGTFGVWELSVGAENMLGVIPEKKYRTGDLSSGGIRVDLHYLQPIASVKDPIVFQTYIGAGIQSGSRNYQIQNEKHKTFATGANVLLRAEWVFHGIDAGRSTWFLSVFGDVKYHMDFTENFNLLLPAVGIHLRRGR